jgi:hypothetical protein
MPTFEGLTGPISFDKNGRRVNYSIDIYRSALNMPLAKVKFIFAKPKQGIEDKNVKLFR